MIDAMTSLAFSVYSGKGVYALLLGSGFSRAADIPTGWEITLDLVRKVAAIEKADCEPDPVQWYSRKFGKEPDYSFLLEELAFTQAERTNVLARYFEATAEEREAGKKVPTVAHRKVAQLVAKGYFQVIVTTNFDRLMEYALEAEGISPTVISTSDMARGAAPLVHSSCTVVKVHGDYRDTRFRNTAKELSGYEPEMDALLDRIFDEYGLIVCGWSATWDAALRAAILRAPNRRYSATWAVKGNLSSEAESLVKFRQATVLQVDSADKFIGSLSEKLEALERFNAPHPLSSAIAVASLKRFLVEDRFRVELRELVTGEVERQVELLSVLPVEALEVTCESLFDRIGRYEASMELTVNLVANGSYYGTTNQAEIWVGAVSRMLDISPPRVGANILLSLRRYPACMLFYAAGIAAIAARKYETLKSLLKDQRSSIDILLEGKDDLLIRKLLLAKAIDWRALQRCLKVEADGTPASDRMHASLRGPFRPFLASDIQYDEAFDRFEYLFALVYLDAQENDGLRLWAPLGRFFRRNRLLGDGLLEEHRKEKQHWGPIKVGLFESSQRFLEVEKSFKDDVLAKVHLY